MMDYYVVYIVQMVKRCVKSIFIVVFFLCVILFFIISPPFQLFPLQCSLLGMCRKQILVVIKSMFHGFTSCKQSDVCNNNFWLNFYSLPALIYIQVSVLFITSTYCSTHIHIYFKTKNYGCDIFHIYVQNLCFLQHF